MSEELKVVGRINMEEDKEEKKRLQEYILSHPEEYPDNLLQTIADLRAQLKRVEDNRDLYFDDLSITKTTLHLAEKALAAKEAELVELQQCRDHWKISYEELRQWKESAMTVLSKIDLQAIGKEIGVRIGHDVSTEILPWIKNAKAELERYKWMIEPILAVNAAVTCTYPCVFEKACREAGRRLEGEGSPKVTESVTSGE